MSMEASFCRDCGASVRPVNDMKCRTCGSETRDDAQFCVGCGTNLISGEASAGTELPIVGFGAAISRGFSNYFTFSGRATRAEYWFWTLFSTLVQGIPLVGWLIGLAVLIPSIAVTSRRLHDIGKSAWWMTVWLPLGGVWVLWFVGFVLEVIGLEESLNPEVEFWEILGTWLVWAGFLTLASIGVVIWWVIWFVRKGDKGPTKYGPDPRQPTSQ